MSYTVLTTSAAHKMFRKFPPHIREHLTAEAGRLADNPELGASLTGVLRAFRSLHTKLNNVSYRIVYETDDRNHEVIIRAVGIRENFYKQLQGLRLRIAA